MCVIKQSRQLATVMNIVPLFFNNKEESNMATQIRKFEQDAIVETIVDRVISSKETKAQYAVKKCKEYKSLYQKQLN